MRKKKRSFVANISLAVMFLLLLPVFFFAVYFFVLGDPIGRMALNKSAKAVVTDLVGIEKFKIDQANILSATFDPAASWQILLDEPFRYQGSHITKPNHLQEKDTPEYIESIFGNIEKGFGCSVWEHMTLGSGTVCASGGIRTCAVEVCLKEGSRSLYVTIMVL